MTQRIGVWIGLLTCLLCAMPTAAQDGFSWVDRHGGLRLTWQGNPLLQYNYKIVPPPAGVPPVFARNAYVHPIWNLAGQVVTDDFAADHHHHRGLWLAWAKTGTGDLKPNFWEIQEGTGRIVFDRFEQHTADGRRAKLVVDHRWQARRGSHWDTVIRERWTLVAHAPRPAHGDHWQFDLTSRQVPAADRPVIVDQLRYGGLGFRGSAHWNGRRTAVTVRTASGDQRGTANGTRPRWCTMGGPLGAGWGGLTLMDNPRNPRAPTPVRVHPSMPFFCYMLAQKEPYPITLDRPLVQRYRVVVHAARPSAKTLDALWREYTRAPAVDGVTAEGP